MPRPLSFRHVETIYAVFLTGSVTGAAVRLHVTQPAVSNILREAEERLGFPLFQRLGGRLVPTRRTEMISCEIERSFSGLLAVNELCARLHSDERRHVKVASTPAFASAALPRALQMYRQTVDDVHFSVVSRSSGHVQSLVASQKADIGFALEEPAIPGVNCELLASPRMVCLLPSGHPLTELSSVSATDLLGHPMVSLTRSEGLEEIIETAFSEAGGFPHIVAECPAALVACAMVEAGMGALILDPISMHIFKNSTIESRPFVPAVHLNLWAYWVGGRQSDFQHEQLLNLVKDSLEVISASIAADTVAVRSNF